MEILLSDLKANAYKVPVGFSSGQLVSVYDTKLARYTGIDIPVISGKVKLPSIYTSYDAWLILECVQGTEDLQVVREYLPITSIVSKFQVTTEEAKELERVARGIIDSKTRGFKYWLGLEELVGQGGDVLPISVRITEINRVWENGKLVYDVESPNINEVYFRPTRNAFGIIADIGPPPWSGAERVANDIKQYTISPYEEGYFLAYFDYYIEGVFGSEIIPQAVRDAMFFLINDLKCGNIAFNGGGYIKSYSNSLGQVALHDRAFSGTGNSNADMLLAPYIERIGRMAII